MNIIETPTEFIIALLIMIGVIRGLRSIVPRDLCVEIRDTILKT